MSARSPIAAAKPAVAPVDHADHSGTAEADMRFDAPAAQPLGDEGRCLDFLELSSGCW